MSEISSSQHAIAARILNQVIHHGASLADALPADAAPLCKHLCFEVCRYYFSLQYILKIFLTTPIRQKEKIIEVLLLIGLYQALYSHKPDYAIVSESVRACATLKKIWAKGLVNKILRLALEKKVSLLNELAQQEIAIALSHPIWLATQLQTAWPSHYQIILQQNNQHPPFTLRVNFAQTNRADYLAKLNQHGLVAHSLDHYPAAIQLEESLAVAALPGFQAGECSVQDASAQLAAAFLEVQPHHRVLDACAAPGGKTAHILESCPQLKQLIAIDISKQRCEKITQTLARLQLAAEIYAEEATAFAARWPGALFDRILLDAPCSATGVIRRHPDIKLLRKETDIPTLAQQQLQLLQALWEILVPGGILLYATCSVLPAENQQVIRQFCQNRTDVEKIFCEHPDGLATEEGLQFFPGIGDGFFYAKLRKLSDV